jgi:cation diffusion facilitator CzcD-associated flavoprotein CzcO
LFPRHRSVVEGGWYWNKYPGAMSDTEAYIYQYSFDKDLLQEWDWKTHYWNQPDILAYLQAVVERHDLAKDIRLNTGIESLVFSDASNSWIVTTSDGETVNARYVVCALGLLSKIYFPDIKGRDSFRGTLVHTGAWRKTIQQHWKDGPSPTSASPRRAFPTCSWCSAQTVASPTSRRSSRPRSSSSPT